MYPDQTPRSDPGLLCLVKPDCPGTRGGYGKYLVTPIFVVQACSKVYIIIVYDDISDINMIMII